MKKLFLGAAITTALSGCLVDDEPINDGQLANTNSPSTVEITVKDDAEVDVGAQLSVAIKSDADGFDGAAPTYQWFSGDDLIPNQTGSTYDVVLADAGKYVKAQVSFTDDAGNAEKSIATSYVPGDNLSFILVLGDAEVGETLTASLVDSDGFTKNAPLYSWNGEAASSVNTYTITDADLGKEITVSVTHEDDRGFETTATYTSKAVSAGSSGSTLAAYITDINSNGAQDGELRIKIADVTDLAAIDAGRLTAKILFQTDDDSTATGEFDDKMYVSTYAGGCCGKSTSHADLSIGVESGNRVIQYRDNVGQSLQYVVDSNGNNISWTDPQEIDFTLSWTLNEWTFSLDGGLTNYGPFPRSAAGTTGVEAIAFKVGTSTKVSTYEAYVDDIVIYNGTANVYEQDFEDGFAINDTLVDNGGFDGSSNEVSVQELIIEDGDASSANIVAYITDVNTNGSQDGELRVKIPNVTNLDAIDAGRLTAKILFQTDADSTASGEFDDKMYVSTYAGGCCGKSTNHADISIGVDQEPGNEGAKVIQYRDNVGQSLQYVTDGDGNNVTWTDPQLINLSLSWTLNDWTYSLDGGFTSFGPFPRSAAGTTGVEAFAFKVGTSSKVSTYEAYIDDIVVYDGTVAVFEEDFQSYSNGDNLVGTGSFDASSNEVKALEFDFD